MSLCTVLMSRVANQIKKTKWLSFKKIVHLNRTIFDVPILGEFVRIYTKYEVSMSPMSTWGLYTYDNNDDYAGRSTTAKIRFVYSPLVDKPNAPKSNVIIILSEPGNCTEFCNRTLLSENLHWWQLHLTNDQVTLNKKWS